jgi:hypothetical protein
MLGAVAAIAENFEILGRYGATALGENATGAGRLTLGRARGDTRSTGWFDLQDDLRGVFAMNGKCVGAVMGVALLAAAPATSFAAPPNEPSGNASCSGTLSVFN